MSAIKKFQDEYNKQAIKMKEMEKEVSIIFIYIYILNYL